MESVAFKNLPYITIGDKYYFKLKRLYLGFDLGAGFEFNSDRIYEVIDIRTPDRKSNGEENLNNEIYIFLSNGVMEISAPYKKFEMLFEEVPEDVSNAL